MPNESGGSGGSSAGQGGSASGGSGGAPSGGSGGSASGGSGGSASGGSGGAGVSPPCEARDLEACEADGDCLEMHAYAVGDERSSGTAFAACVSRSYECAIDGDALTCARSPEGELFVFRSQCLPPGWPALDAIECDASGLADCETLDVVTCEASRFCRTIDGWLFGGGEPLVPIGCTAFDTGCGDEETCAYDGTETGEVYVFPSTGLPAGWVETYCTTGE